MKKVLIITSGVCLLALIALRQPSTNDLSISAAIKNDPSKIKELLSLSDSIRKSRQNKHKINPDDMLDAKMLSEYRKRDSKVFKTNGNNFPIIRVSMLDIMQIIDTGMTSPNVDPGDSLTFYLGTYKEKGSWVKRYNARNARGGKDASFKELTLRPGFLIGVFKADSAAGPGLMTAKYFDVQRICPPPTDSGCE